MAQILKYKFSQILFEVMRRKTGHLQSHPIPSLAMIKREPKDKRQFYLTKIIKLVFHQKLIKMTIMIIIIINDM